MNCGLFASRSARQDCFCGRRNGHLYRSTNRKTQASKVCDSILPRKNIYIYILQNQIINDLINSINTTLKMSIVDFLLSCDCGIQDMAFDLNSMGSGRIVTDSRHMQRSTTTSILRDTCHDEMPLTYSISLSTQTRHTAGLDDIIFAEAWPECLRLIPAFTCRYVIDLQTQ